MLSTNGIFALRLDASGLPVGERVLVSTTVALQLRDPALGFDATGNAVVVWARNPNGSDSIEARRYDATGSPAGTEFQVNTPAPDPRVSQTFPWPQTGVPWWCGWTRAAYADSAMRRTAIQRI
jgi:hypothetical protein